MTAPTDPSCIFCRIAAGEMAAVKVCEDASTVAFMDIFPATRGHLLVIGKAHYPDLATISSEQLAAVGETCRRLAAPLLQTVGADGLRVMQFNGEAAGQTVFHYHVHLRPSYAGQPAGGAHGARQADPQELEQIASGIRARLPG